VMTSLSRAVFVSIASSTQLELTIARHRIVWLRNEITGALDATPPPPLCSSHHVERLQLCGLHNGVYIFSFYPHACRRVDCNTHLIIILLSLVLILSLLCSGNSPPKLYRNFLFLLYCTILTILG
jgi:hypothetical protein